MVKKWLKEYISKNIYDILIVLVMLIIGVAVGIGVYLFAPEASKELLITSAKSIFEISKDEAYIKTNIILNGIEINLVILVIFIVSSMTLFGKYIIQLVTMLKGVALSLYVIILYKVFGLGYGTLAVLLLVVLINLIYLPAFIYLTITFLEVHFNIFKTKIKSYSITDLLGVVIKIIIPFIVIFSSIVVEQIMSSVVLSIFLKIN